MKQYKLGALEHKALSDLTCCIVCSDEESSLQRLYIDMVLRSEYIPTELKQHAMIKPAIQTMEQLTLHNQSGMCRQVV